jgi:alpha/beta superfamily hydrolase
MSRFMLILLVISLSACSPRSTPTTIVEPTQALQIPVPSDWAGAITHADGTSESVVVHLNETGGTLNFEPQTKTYTIEEVQLTDPTISFKVTAQNEISFSGKFDSIQITGRAEQNGQTESFALLPLSSESKESLNGLLGTYQFDSGESLLINLAPEYSNSGLYFFGQGLMVTHFGTGAIRALYPIATDTFLVGSARAIGYPFTEQIKFLRDANGIVTSLIWQTRDPITGDPGEAKQATHLSLSSEVVHFTSEDGTNLTGLLTLPATPEPYPAIMMLHGSEPGTKENFGNQQMSAFMASHGIAILTYDKRGAGESQGTYVESASERNLNLTAQDATAGVEYLKSRPEIKADRIGLTGFSQAGWVIPLAASQSEDVSYFIILSGPITSVGHESIYSSYTNDGESTGNYSQEEISKRLANAPHSGFDSTPIIAELDQLGLWIWGDQDKSLPFFESEDNLKEIIAQGESNFTYLVLSNADHNLQQTKQGLFNEIPYSPGYHQDYYKTIVKWLEEYVK